jgi:hypothetical protein
VPESQKRHQFTFKEKWRFIKLVDGMSRNTVAEKYNIDPTLLSKWKKERSCIEDAVARGFGNKFKIAPLRVYKDVFEKAFEVYSKARAMYAGVSIQYIRSFCVAHNEQFARLKKKTQFEELQTFRQHYNLASRKRTGVTQLLPKLRGPHSWFGYYVAKRVQTTTSLYDGGSG